jgi:hypothetical protein
MPRFMLLTSPSTRLPIVLLPVTLLINMTSIVSLASPANKISIAIDTGVAINRDSKH